MEVKDMYGSFYGWYMKCQSDTQTLAVIPAVHQIGRKRTCSIQLITESNAWTVTGSAKLFRQKNKDIYIGENRFGEKGVQLDVHTRQLHVKGKLDFGSLSSLKYDIMGPFAFVPFLECRHKVWSMRHTVNGTVYVNGQEYAFQNALGYWEGDSGRSFPKEYAWTQCCFPNGSLMLSVADIPMAGFHFTGIIGVILWKGRQYRIATYLGAKAIQIKNQTLRIVQGDMEFEAYLLEKNGHPLKAPNNGMMTRTIHESATCRAFYRFRKKGQTIFSFESKLASFEYEYSR